MWKRNARLWLNAALERFRESMRVESPVVAPVRADVPPTERC